MLSFLFTTLVFLSFAQAEIPHLDLELSGAEISKIYDSQKRIVRISEEKSRLDQAVRAGKRNLEWLQFINEDRSEKISFTNPANQRGIPIDKPSEYNEAIAYQKYTDTVAQMPLTMRKVIVDGENFTKEPPVAIDDYILWGDKIDRAYQTAIRWMMMEPYLSQLANRRYQDMRGYYFIEQEPNRDQTLDSVHNLPPEKKEQITNWLIGVCLNSRLDETSCTTQVKASIRQKTAKAFYLQYRPASQKIWNSFYSIPTLFPGIEWTVHQPDLAKVAFLDPPTQIMRDFLRVNLEDEWKWENWKLKIDFGSSSGVDVIWEPGITPHVPGLGSNQIYMDSNAPLTEWDVQWTIRHEFGHVLGFPDCYLEFYDASRGVIINYQFDTTDLMCSRSGRLKERHFTEMKQHYLK